MKLFLFALAIAALSVACVQTGDGVEARGATIAAMQCGRRWRRIDASGPRPRVFANVTSTPFGAVLTGGLGAGGLTGDAWRWDGARWTLLPADGAPAPRWGHAAVWTGASLCVWGGEADGVALGDGACWTPGDSAWRSMSAEGALSPRTNVGACWTGRELVIFGGQDAEGDSLGDGAAWDPRSNRWRALSLAGAPRARSRAHLVSLNTTGGPRVLVWGGSGDALALGAEDAARYDPEGDRWTSMDLTGAPNASSGPLATPLDGGLWALHRDGVSLYDGSAARWRSLRNDPPFGPRFAATPTPTPGGVWLWGGRDERGLLGDGGCYDIASERWTRAPADGAPTPRQNAVTFWDGTRVMVLWGEDEDGLRDDAYALEP